MSYFNQTTKNSNKTQNKEGFDAYTSNDFRQDLAMLVFSSVTTVDQFYEYYDEKLV